MTSHQARRIGRRTFLRAIASGAVAAGVSRLFTAENAVAQSPPSRFVIREDRFGRIFPNLPPFATPSSELTVALRDIGKPGGILDAKDNLAAGPIQLIVDPALSANNGNNPTMTAGATFMGQFMDHDMTFDLSSRLGVPTDPASSANSRTPAFDLDAVYGAGPLVDLELYVVENEGASPPGSRSRVAASSRMCPANPPAKRSSPTRATTKT